MPYWFLAQAVAGWAWLLPKTSGPAEPFSVGT
uniref:Uncharacterized protein n=1 Tax=Setaria viridis TaxID=4556 RepID=A0A4U6WAZ6_SETVI|nr:hypothetical protein SEVIR_2G336750v2 [Setaria viridis]